MKQGQCFHTGTNGDTLQSRKAKELFQRITELHIIIDDQDHRHSTTADPGLKLNSTFPGGHYTASLQLSFGLRPPSPRQVSPA